MRRILILTVLLGTTAASAVGQIKYPETKRIDHVDELHGTKVPDPYRWLEDDVRVSGDVKHWVESQNEITFEYLSRIPEREVITKRLTELWN